MGVMPHSFFNNTPALHNMAYSGFVPTAREMQRANYYIGPNSTWNPKSFNFKTDSVLSAYYVLRAENLESCFYLYRLTRDQQYLFMGKSMVNDILTYFRTKAGFASFKSVTTFKQINSIFSFLFAKTFKYAYLIFAPDNTIELDKTVFTAEAHPFNNVK